MPAISVWVEKSGAAWFGVAHHGGRLVATATGGNRKEATAAVAGTEARMVGHVMSTNPLYPIVPGQRVVGQDPSLVGCSGRQDAEALRAKLDRLRAGARGFDAEKTVGGAGSLTVYAVERVIAKAAREGLDAGVQLSRC